MDKKNRIKIKKNVKYSICSCGYSKKIPYCDNQHRIYNQKNNVAKATVVTAIPISDKIKNQVLKKIQTLSNKSIEIENIIDKTIIGGFILRYENREYNASFLQRLNKLKAELIQ